MVWVKTNKNPARSGNNRSQGTCFRCGRAGHLRAQCRASRDIRGNEIATIASKTEEHASGFQEYETQLIGDQYQHVLVNRSQPRYGNGMVLGKGNIFSLIKLPIVFLSIISCLGMVTAANPKQLETKPMVCSTSKALHHFQLPLSINCPDLGGDNAKLTEAELELFKCSLAQYTSIGHFCRKAKTTVRTHAEFLNMNQKKKVFRLISKLHLRNVTHL